MVTLIALQDFSPDGSRHIKAGESFEISEKSAQFLIKIKRAKLIEDDKKPKGRYHRRDLRSEN